MLSSACVRAAAIVLLMLTASLVTPALAQEGYTFTSLATIPGSAPGPEAGAFTNDFEPYAISNRGHVAFVADVDTGGEGVFIRRGGTLSQIVRTGQAAPGGGTFGTFEMGRLALNVQGAVVFGFTLEPLAFPLGVNAGLYRFSGTSSSLSAIVVPGSTPAPDGGVFAGIGFNTSLNAAGEVVFSGIVPTTAGISGLIGMGVFRVRDEQITGVVLPGSPVPGGGTFDFAQDASINNSGDIAFGAHVAGEECIDFSVPQSDLIFCGTSIYVRRAATGSINSIAHQGSPAPGGGTYRFAFGPLINNAGDILFLGDLTPAPDAGHTIGIFVDSRGTTIPVARPGDPMPGGGHFASGSLFGGNASLNNQGEVAFNASLDTDANSDGISDTGLYVWSRGAVRLVARTGTVLPGIGTIAHVNAPVLVGALPFSGAALNDLGQVFFQATLTDGSGVLLVATP